MKKQYNGSNTSKGFSTVEEAVADLQSGKVIIVTDDENRENEGDFLALADKVTPETINFMIRIGRGLVCTPITEKRARELELPSMVLTNTDNHETAFTVSVDYISTTTGISAFDRALTIRELINPLAQSHDFRRPGHVFPLTAREGGVLSRPGHTEAAIDVARLCHAYPAAVICEIINDDGTMARIPDLLRIAAEYDLKLLTIQELIRYIDANKSLLYKEVDR